MSFGCEGGLVHTDTLLCFVYGSRLALDWQSTPCSLPLLLLTPSTLPSVCIGVFTWFSLITSYAVTPAIRPLTGDMERSSCA